MICVIQITSALQLDTFINVLLNIKNSAIGKHFSTAHGDTNLLKESHLRILKKCQGKFDCLVYEILFIEQRNPCLNTQTDSIGEKRFVLKNIPLPIVFLVFTHFFFLSLFDLIMTSVKRRNDLNIFLICLYEMFYHNFLSLNVLKHRFFSV